MGTYGIVPYVNPVAPGAVAGIVGAGGPSGVIAFGMGFLFSSKTQHAYFLMGGLVILSAFSCLLLNIKGHGGILFKSDDATPMKSLQVPKAEKSDGKELVEEITWPQTSFWTLVSQSSPLPRWLTFLSPETANAQTKMTSSCHPNGNSQIGRSSSD